MKPTNPEKMKTETEKKLEWTVVFWHNDYPDGVRKNSYYGKDGTIFNKVQKNIQPQANLNWYFHGGFIKPERANLLKRLRRADVLIAANPWNMDLSDDNMHWCEAENSLLDILKPIKKENNKLKIFFLHEPYHLKKQFQKIGDILCDVHEEILYDFFRNK